MGRDRIKDNLSSFFASRYDLSQAVKAKRPIILIIYKAYLSLSELSANSLPEDTLTLIRDFADIFPEDMPPGLPPIRGIEHQIDLVPGVPLQKPSRLLDQSRGNERASTTSR